jgi:hypothetical protein
MRALVALAVACGLVAPADAGPRKRRPAKHLKKRATPKTKHGASKNIVRPADADRSPAYRYAHLNVVACKAELARRKIAYTDEPATRGVRMPIRLAGKLRGIEFRTNLKAARRATTPWEVIDCRLVLALDDFAVILAAYDVVDVRHYSMYRRPPQDWADDKIGTRHLGALAIDAARFNLKDGSYLDVDKHFNGAIGAKTCGDRAGPKPVTAEALKLREILCKAVEQRLFHVVLTPNYDRPHKNHFHLEITEGWKSFLVN